MTAKLRVGLKVRRVLLLLGGVGLATLVLLMPVEANRDGHRPPEACDCHSDNPAPSVHVNVDGWPTAFVPGKTYRLNVSADGGPPGTKGGFSMGVTKGTLLSDDPVVTTTGKEATHANPSKRLWTIDWKAPAEDSGETRLVVYVNNVNGDDEEGPEDLWNFVELRAPEKALEPPKPSSLGLVFAGKTGPPIAGQNVTITAKLANFAGLPIPRATVTFYQNTTYGQLPVGRAVTGADGSAPVTWKVPAACECRFFAHYDGSARNLSTNATGVAKITDPNGVFDSLYPPPAAHVFTSWVGVMSGIGAVVVGVWATLAYAAAAVIRIWSLGARNEGAGAPAKGGPSKKAEEEQR